MDKRLDTSRSSYQEDVGIHSKKTKKRSSKKSSVLGPWMNSIPSNQNSDMAPSMEYQQVMWQSNIQQNIQSNGQRLFTAASDPSMCGYAQMPMTYTMEPVSLPTMYRLYQPVPFSGVRAVHNRPRRHYNQNHPLNLGINSMANGYTSLQENGMESPMPVNYQNGDYTSLPPTANKTNEINGEELNSEHRRYSDPGLGSAEAPVHMQSEDSDSVGSGSSITTIGRSNKLVLSLIEQMTELKKSNSQLFKELNETKSELGSMKTKFAQCKYNTSSDYQPGMLSDLIREIRQANKTFEEGLAIKVKSMVEEKLNERSSEVTSLSNQILKLTDEKEESERRIAKLEEEVAALKLQANNEGREIAAFEEETLALRRELQEARASKTLAETHVANPLLDAWTVEDTRTTISSTQPALAISNREDNTLEDIASLTSTDNPSSKKGDSGQEVEPAEARNAEDKEDASIEDVIAPVKDEEVDSTSIVEADDATTTSSLTEIKVKKDDGLQRSQRGSSKKRKKKGMSKRSFSEADGACYTIRDQRTVSEDEHHRLDDDASRAITEIPEVTVVGGGSFVPKDLCSTGILTSRVLTAPSRATYTTAYI